MATTKINVEIGLDVTDDTLNQILYLLTIWQNNNPDMCIVGEDVVTADGYKTVFKAKHKKEWKGDTE